MAELLTVTFFSILAAGFLVGIVVGLTGMGGGALMTPALLFLGVGEAATVVTADLTAAAVYKTGGAIVHKREGSPNMALAKWLILGSVPMALLGPHLVAWFTEPEPTLVMPTSRPPRAPTSRVGMGRMCGSGSASGVPPRTRRRLT